LAKERRLGRGLEALLGRISEVESPTASSSELAAAEPPTPPVVTRAPHGNGDPLRRGPSPSAELQDGSGGPSPSASSFLTPLPGAVDFASPQSQAILESAGSSSQIPQSGNNPRTSSSLPQTDGSSRLIEVEISQIDSNPFQPRGEFPAAEIQSLADSLRAHGLLQPLIVRRHGDRFQLVAGERRLRAAVQAGWRRVPVRVVEADDRELAELALVENLHRKDLNPLEKAISFQRYLREFGVTQEQLASRLKMDRSTIANLIRLLELPAPVQQALRDGRISQAHARALLSLGDERTQIAFCERIQKEGWSVRQTEAMVNKVLAEQEEEETDQFRVISADPPARPSRSQSQHIAALEREFRLALGTNVQIIHTRRGKGRVIIHFRNHDEFERIRRQICEGATVPQAKAS
jgi:ParB family chromosome partitioning protein